MTLDDPSPTAPLARLLALAAGLDIDVRELHGEELAAAQSLQVSAIAAPEPPPAAGGAAPVAGARIALATGEDRDLAAGVLAFVIALLHVDMNRFEKAAGRTLAIGDRLPPTGAERERMAARTLFEAGRRAPHGANFRISEADPHAASLLNRPA